MITLLLLTSFVTAARADDARCRALDLDGKVIVELVADSSLECRAKLKDELRRWKCDGTVKEYRFQVQWGDRPPSGSIVFCN